MSSSGSVAPAAPATPQAAVSTLVAGSPAASPTAASPPPGGAEMEILCVKCWEPTSMHRSTPSGGRNPLKRVCNECSATD
eukprot:13918573-Alexandrium_andersonii.AAC.1